MVFDIQLLAGGRLQTIHFGSPEAAAAKIGSDYAEQAFDVQFLVVHRELKNAAAYSQTQSLYSFDGKLYDGVECNREFAPDAEKLVGFLKDPVHSTNATLAAVIVAPVDKTELDRRAAAVQVKKDAEALREVQRRKRALALRRRKQERFGEGWEGQIITYIAGGNTVSVECCGTDLLTDFLSKATQALRPGTVHTPTSFKAHTCREEEDVPVLPLHTVKRNGPLRLVDVGLLPKDRVRLLFEVGGDHSPKKRGKKTASGGGVVKPAKLQVEPWLEPDGTCLVSVNFVYRRVFRVKLSDTLASFWDQLCATLHRDAHWNISMVEFAHSGRTVKSHLGLSTSDDLPTDVTLAACGIGFLTELSVSFHRRLGFAQQQRLMTKTLPPPPQEYDVFVKTLTGRTLTLRVRPEMDLEDLKKLIHHKENIPTNAQRIVYAGQQLEHGYQLYWDYGIVKESMLHLVLRLRGGMAHVSSFMYFGQALQFPKRIHGFARIGSLTKYLHTLALLAAEGKPGAGLPDEAMQLASATPRKSLSATTVQNYEELVEMLTRTADEKASAWTPESVPVTDASAWRAMFTATRDWSAASRSNLGILRAVLLAYGVGHELRGLDDEQFVALFQHRQATL